MRTVVECYVYLVRLVAQLILFVACTAVALCVYALTWWAPRGGDGDYNDLSGSGDEEDPSEGYDDLCP